MKRPAKVYAVLRHQQHFLLVALFGLIANPGISAVAARSLRQGIGMTLSGPVQENSPAEEEEAEEALADEEASQPTDVHDLALVSRQRDLETQPPTPSPSSTSESAPPPAPMPQPILAPPPFAASPMSPFPAPGLSQMPAPMLGPMPAPMLAPLPSPMLSPLPAMGPAAVMAPAPAVMQSPYGPDEPVVQAEESTEETTTTTTTTTATTNTTTTTEPQNDGHTVKLETKFENIDFNALTADKSLLDDFEETVKEDIAEKLGHGVTPDDVELEIRPGSVIVEATVTVQGSSFEELETVQKGACTNSLADQMAKDIGGIEGISNAASGNVQGVVHGKCASAAPKVKAASPAPAPPPPKPQTAVDTDDSDDMDACHPTCVEGQGVCSDKVCFCKSPFRGVRCERIRKSASARLSYPLAAGIAAFGLFTGVVVGVIFFATVASKKLKQTTAVPEKKAETWQAEVRG